MTPSATTASSDRFIPEIAGLRTVALLLVATFHIWFGKVSGGVDIFLFIGAYLMTRSLVAAADSRTFTRPLTFIVRKFTRLLPTALASIVLTVAVVLFLTSATSWETLFEQAFAAGTYWMNIWLQGEAVDYFAADRYEASFFQHFWSLSLQGQVFIIWPFVHLAVEGIARLTRIPMRPLLISVFGFITVASFAWAVVSARSAPEIAYFDFWSRLWEFSAGSVLALIAPWLRYSQRTRHWMTALGLFGAVMCGVVMPIDAPYASWPSLWPILCAVLVIAAADSKRAPGDRPDPILGHPVLARMGGYTYALYLTHWPVLILFANLTGTEVPDVLGGFVLLAISSIAAVAITVFVERPVASWVRKERRWKGRGLPRVGVRSIAVLVIGLVVSVGLGYGGAQRVEASYEGPWDEVWNADVSQLGPQATNSNQEFESLLPADSIAQKFAVTPGETCPNKAESGAHTCIDFGSPDAEHSVVVLGSSHSLVNATIVWETMRTRDDVYIRTIGGPGCYYPGPDAVPGDEAKEECISTWNAGLTFIDEFEPDVVFLIGTLSAVGAPDHLQDGASISHGGRTLGDLRPIVADYEARGIDVIVMRDLPRFDHHPYQCGLAHGFDSAECAVPVPERTPELAAFMSDMTNVGATWVDLEGAVCPEGFCLPAVGGLVTYMDMHHLHVVFARSLAQVFADQVQPDIDWWPKRVWSDF